MAEGGFRDPLIGYVAGDMEEWLMDWMTASQLPKFNGRGVLRVVKEVGLGAWLTGFGPDLLGPARERALSQRNTMDKEGIVPLILGRTGYPHLLAQLPDAPWVLFVKGNLDALSKSRPVAVVGTRRASSVGLGAVDGLFAGMEGLDWVMVSGMADGIDAKAHGRALEMGVPTVACLAHGLHSVHPRSNARLAGRILDSGGCWVTEYRWGVPPTKYTFPARNRIIAGLVEAAVVVESGHPGGSLITGRLAQDYDRRVFALSPTWCSNAMRGNALLIREQVAELLHDPADLPEAMGWKAAERTWEGAVPGTAPLSAELMGALDLYVSRPFDEVVDRMAGEPRMVRKALLEAELSGWVRCWSGDRFTRTLR